MERYVTRSDPLRRITDHLDILICVLRRWDLNIKYQAFPEFSLERNHHFLRALKRRRSKRKNSKWEVMCSWYPVTRQLFRVSSSVPVLERYRTRLILRHCTGVFNIFYSILLRSTASSRDACVVPPVDIGEFGSQLGMKIQRLELVPATPMRWQLAQVWCYRAFNATRARSHVTYVHGSKRWGWAFTVLHSFCLYMLIYKASHPNSKGKMPVPFLEAIPTQTHPILCGIYVFSLFLTRLGDGFNKFRLIRSFPLQILP